MACNYDIVFRHRGIGVVSAFDAWSPSEDSDSRGQYGWCLFARRAGAGRDGAAGDTHKLANASECRLAGNRGAEGTVWRRSAGCRSCWRAAKAELFGLEPV